MSPTVSDQLSPAAVAAEVEALQQALAERDQEIERLRQLAAACCPWHEQPWHRLH